MFCFNCKFEITKSLGNYPSTDKDIIFFNFFPNLKIFNCEKCGIISVDHATINKNDLDIFYEKHFEDIYGVYADKGIKAKCGNNAKYVEKYINDYFQSRSDGQYNAISPYINSSTINNILEFGAGLGLCLKAMGKRFPKANLYSHDLNKNNLIKDRNIFVDQNHIKYDLIIISHVLEHMLFPQNTVKYLLSRMNKNGILVIDVPNQKKYILQYVKTDNLYSLALAPHLVFFSMKSIANFFNDNFKELELLALKTSGGADKSLSDQPFIRSTINTYRKQKLSLKGKVKKFLQSKMKPIFLLLSFLYNLNAPRYSFAERSINYDEDICMDIRVVLRLSSAKKATDGLNTN